MTTGVSRWIVPAVGLVLGLLFAAAELGRQASLARAAVTFAIVAGYVIALRVLQSRSDVASLLSGLPRDERWEWITCGHCRSPPSSSRSCSWAHSS